MSGHAVEGVPTARRWGRPSLGRARSAALVGMLTLLGWSVSASAYVRYRTDGGVEFAWPGSCIFVTGYVGDFTQMPAEEIHNAVNAAATAWSRDGDPCTFLSFDVTFVPGPAPARVVAGDRKNVFLFRTETWCLLDDKGACDPEDTNYGPEALALTTVNAGVTTGTIRDVDIEVNALWNEWGDLVAHPEMADTGVHDLQNALTHEFGHLVGLDHTCFTGGAAPLDHQGQPIPLCGTSAPADVQETTMYNSAPRGEIQKRTLAPDDQLAVCEIYPAAADPGVCAPAAAEESGCGCVTGGPGGEGPFLTLALTIAAAILFSRRRTA